MENRSIDILSKYSIDTLKGIDINNYHKIIEYLVKEKCSVFDDIITDYLDVFTIPYDEFVQKTKVLNEKYSNEFFNLVAADLNYLEEYFL